MSRIIYLLLLGLILCCDVILARISVPARIKHNLDTGDLILRTDISPESLALAHGTQGPYAHIGLVYRDSQSLHVIECYPEKGIVYHKPESFMFPSFFTTCRLAILRFNKEDRSQLNKVIAAFLANSRNIQFDMQLSYDEYIPTLEDLQNKQFSYYCVEMVNMIFQVAYGSNYLNWPNQYDIVYNNFIKYKPLHEEFISKFFPQEEVRLVKFREVIMNAPKKVLLLPSGIINSPEFTIVYQGEDLKSIPPMLKVFVEN